MIARRARSLLIAFLAGIATLAGVPAVGSAQAPPTVVLVHGAFSDKTSWAAVEDTLRGTGYRAIAVDNPLRGPAHDTAALNAVLDTVDGPVVLAGHSYGGVVITNTTHPSVEALVYVAGIAPVPGEPAQLTIDPIRYPEGKLLPPVVQPRIVSDDTNLLGTNIDLVIDPDRFREAFAADLPEQQARELAENQRSFALTANLEPVTHAAWQTVPSWYVIPRQDMAVPTRAQRVMAERAGATATEVDGAHAIHISRPDVVAETIMDAASSTR
ncbi:alpha/beta hydrolase [Hoyosella sp. G463]|uniref:Alpha/beta hydrolase n=1 Tax=Lolliginicoccus lacisalsi TaxID=2742202 RepID=A0A927PMR6_9ACTN|nr:alpha/beta hydrolase [Lolliginicoccus lacisalsi]MBD8506977.1 alpha/beta hydrolase [Lolliginicoccus lacisalsi]